MKLTQTLGCGLLTASAALLLAPIAAADYDRYATLPTATPVIGAVPSANASAAYGPLAAQGVQPKQQPQLQPSQPPVATARIGYQVPQGGATTRVAYNYNNYNSLSMDPSAGSLPGAADVDGGGEAPAAPGQGAAPAPAFQGAAGCNNGACGAYGCNDIGYNTYGCGYGAGGRWAGKHRKCDCDYYNCQGRSRWFGGVYGLLMERDGGPRIPLAFAVADGSLAAGDYPTSDSVVLTTRNVDIGFQGGFEARLGRWLGGGACCGPRWALEGVYWGLFEDNAYAAFNDTAALRTYSMLDPRGLEYDSGSGWRPVRHYWDYAPPVNDNTVGATLDDIIVTRARVRSSFELHNVEVNLLRFGFGGYGGGVAVGAVGGRVGGGGLGGNCDACSGADACCGAGGSRFCCTGICGFRFLNLTETFMYGVNFQNTTTSANGYLDYWSDVTNDLYGFQLGGRGHYRLGSAGRWGLHLATNVGIYGNDIEVWQRMDSPTGSVRFIQTAENFNVRASKTDVSMIGEIRAGLSYLFSDDCRFYAGWRAVGITGVALANDQAPAAFIDAAQLASYVNSSGSLIVHGLQTGFEWNY